MLGGSTLSILKHLKVDQIAIREVGLWS